MTTFIASLPVYAAFQNHSLPAWLLLRSPSRRNHSQAIEQVPMITGSRLEDTLDSPEFVAFRRVAVLDVEHAPLTDDAGPHAAGDAFDIGGAEDALHRRQEFGGADKDLRCDIAKRRPPQRRCLGNCRLGAGQVGQ
jgi:hypothetical protein